MRVVKIALAALAGIVALVALALIYGQRQFADGFFDFGNIRTFDGYIIEKPAPVLVTSDAARRTDYALVGEGKHGAQVGGLNGRFVRLRGTLIRRDGIEMIEVEENSIEPGSDSQARISSEVLPLGRHELAGEIVDSKCYLGVMNPGAGKTHRECASLCIRGGIPPLFVVSGADGRKLHLWLTSSRKEPVNDRILDFIAEPVVIDGNVERIGDRLYFLIEPGDIRRIGRSTW